ncbi:MAG: ABC transporter ATP-binding protein [Chloroflexi bacterium AL-W]|nr:ABC transporter ATP-binding protein [Chloroflexi bacterium AL-N1]NOK69516.1 ABC transporter ATP-binding protein [Chloroflexi bacterium AL-N10]NOK77481.1 ABC transporter ATP-binding protein [Chloroflexi bacterium AL-N5]NOK84332.1 ABC transporter ATP-binding protein [Chloroflexi bacterium AL-W]NOK91502.1 ABC transporter ATP-binding protein [Chloroflexi bacterium AL-N15]
MNSLLIDLRDVNKSFPVGDSTVQVLKNISFQVQTGEFVAIVGQSGSGKSTLLNMLTGVDRPTSGEVVIAGQPLGTQSEDELALWRRSEIGIIFQFFNLVPGLTLGQNVRLPMDLAAMIPASERPTRVQRLLEDVGLADRLNWMPSRISGGDQQRAAIARANANDPPIIFGDEATGRQDSRSALACFDLFKQWVANGKTFLLVTHSRELAMQTQRVIELADGSIVSDTRIAN